jgi:2-dehydropantoate 2-reductase
MQIAVVGVGGVGGYFGARLIQAGARVSFIARGAQLAALRAQGLRVESISGDLALPEVVATDDPSQVGPADLVLLTVKSWQLDAALAQIGPLLGPETGVLPLLNGVEASDRVARALGEQHALDGTCYIYAMIAAPGLIRHFGITPSVTFGERDNRVSARAAGLRELLEVGGVRATIPADIRAAVWTKFVFGATTSGLGALTRTPLDVLRELPETRPLFAQGMRETVAVGQAHSVAIGEAQVEAALATLAGLPQGTTASMQRDMMEGRPSELEAQNGAVVRLGRAAQVPTPLHSLIYAALLPQELRARGQQTP